MCPGECYSPLMHKSYAIYAEYAEGSNKLMKNGLNRRVLNRKEAHGGRGIALNDDGSVSLAPGTYRLTGFSTVTMQTTFAPEPTPHDNNYPGYCLLYPRSSEGTKAVLNDAIAFGSPATSTGLEPSLFDAIHTFTDPTTICLGHQAGDDLLDDVYLSMYEIAGVASNYHVVARLAITEM
jgi:hypothetical protein